MAFGRQCFLGLVLLVIITALSLVAGHGRLIKPVGRATMWRYGYKTPVDYNDHQLYCGGRGHQWGVNGGKCGVCGDAHDQPQPRDHESGGKYGLGIIVERYTQGQVIDVNVELTANHKGHFEFRICDTNNPKIIATEECLNRNLLKDINGQTEFSITPGRDFNFKLLLPPYLICSHCVFQWKYQGGQDWNNAKPEHFINCADVAINVRGSPFPHPNTNKPSTKTPYVPPPVTHKPYIPPPPDPGTRKPIFLYPYSPPKPQTTTSPFRPTLLSKCLPGCFYLCQISIRLCPAVCLNCYTVPS